MENRTQNRHAEHGIMSSLKLVLGACLNSFLVFVSDLSRSGLAKKLVQILDSLVVLP